MDTRGPVTAQRVPMAAGMPGAIPHGMGPNAPPPARPVKQHQMLVLAAHCAAFVVSAFSLPVLYLVVVMLEWCWMMVMLLLFVVLLSSGFFFFLFIFFCRKQ